MLIDIFASFHADADVVEKPNNLNTSKKETNIAADELSKLKEQLNDIKDQVTSSLLSFILHVSYLFRNIRVFSSHYQDFAEAYTLYISQSKNVFDARSSRI